MIAGDHGLSTNSSDMQKIKKQYCLKVGFSTGTSYNREHKRISIHISIVLRQQERKLLFLIFRERRRHSRVADVVQKSMILLTAHKS